MLSRYFTAAIFLTAVSFSAILGQTPSPSPTPEAADPVTAATYTRPDSRTRFKRYVNGMFGPVNLGRITFNSGIGTWRNSPEEWGGQWEGFGRRMASNLGKNVIGQSVAYGLGEALKYDSHYYRSKKKGAGPKIKNALLSTVTARDRNGKRVLGIPRIVGSYTSNIIAAETWYPARYDWKDGAKRATFSFGTGAAFNLFKEFIWKK